MIDVIAGASPLVEYRPVLRDSDYRVGADGSVWSKKSGEWRQLAGSLTEDGYLVVEIGGVRQTIHSLVLEAFVCLRPSGLKGLHENDVKTDNRLENLRWGTNRENHEDAVRNGRVTLKLSRETAIEAVEMSRQGLTQAEIAQKLGVSAVCVHHVLTGRLWAEATGTTPQLKTGRAGPREAIEIAQFHSWGWPQEAIIAFLEVKPYKVDRVLAGESYGALTGLASAPVVRLTRSQEIESQAPEIIRLHREEGWSTKRLSDRFSISLRKIQYIVA